MTKTKLPVWANRLAQAIKREQPAILTAVGIAGMLTTVVMAVKVTPKAVRLLDREKADRLENNIGDDNENIDGLIKIPDDKIRKYGYYRLPTKDTIKIVWRLYAPSAILCAASVACLIGSHAASTKRNMALAAAYTISESALKEYREQVIETVGEKKEREVSDAIAKKKIEGKPVSANEVVITKKGNVLCFDVLSGRYFRSDIDAIKRTVNELNRTMLGEMEISLNEFYSALGLSEIKLGDDLGWNVNRGLIDVLFSSQLSEDGEPCVVIGYRIAPQYDYRVF